MHEFEGEKRSVDPYWTRHLRILSKRAYSCILFFLESLFDEMDTKALLCKNNAMKS